MKHSIGKEEGGTTSCASNRVARLAGTALVACVALAATLTGASAEAGTTAEEVASLYGPQPPANATFLRVVNLSARPARVALPGGAGTASLEPGAATRFTVVRPGTSLDVLVDGVALRAPAQSHPVRGDTANARDASTATAGTAITVALVRDSHGWHERRVAAPHASLDALRATLRVFNFVPGCAAQVVLPGSGTPVFTDVPVDGVAARAINPVGAKLAGRCSRTTSPTSAAWPLPALAPGDAYSLFLWGAPGKPTLTGVRDALAWPPSVH